MTPTRSKVPSIAVIGLGALLLLGAILFTQGTQRCGPVFPRDARGVSLTESQKDNLVLSDDTVASADPRIQRENTEHHCVTVPGRGNQGGTVFLVIGALVMIGGALLLVRALRRPDVP